MALGRCSGSPAWAQFIHMGLSRDEEGRRVSQNGACEGTLAAGFEVGGQGP